MELKGIESKFIESAEGWDEQDVLVLTFYDCVLKKEAFEGLKGSEMIDFHKKYNCNMSLDQNIFEVILNEGTDDSDYIKFSIESYLKDYE